MDTTLVIFIMMACFLGLPFLIKYSCEVYFKYKLDHFKQVERQIMRSNPTKQGEHNGKE